MTKQQLFRRALPIAITLIAVLLLAFSCSALKTNSVEPELSNPNEDYAHLGSLAVSNIDVYNSLIDNYGALELSNSVDTELLTNGAKDYIALAKSDADFNVQEELEKSIFSGYTLEEIQVSLTAEEIQKYEDNFNDSLVLNGYASIDDFKEKLYLNHARVLFARDAVMNDYKDSSSEEPTIALGDLKSHYEKKYYEQACVVKVKFSTIGEATDALVRAGLDVNADGEVVKAFYKDGEYIAPTDIVNYPMDPEVLETLKVTDEEILEAYVNIYNERYGYRTPITYSEGSILECGNEDVTYDFEETFAQSNQLADYMFRVLDTERNTDIDEDAKPFTAEPKLLAYAQSQDNTTKNAYYIMYKVSGDNQKVFRDLFDEMTDEAYAAMLDKKPSDVAGGTNQALLDELLNLVVKSYSSQQSVYNDSLYKLRLDQELTIYDSFLELNFKNSYGETVSNKGDNKIVYSYIDNAGNTVNVTADEFFNTLAGKFGATSVMSMINTEMSLKDKDFVNSVITDAKEEEIKESLTQYKLNFQQGAYLQYGFDPTVMSWNQFIYSAFQVRTEVELYNSLVKNSVTLKYNEELFNSAELLDVYYDLMDTYYQEAFEIDILHFLVYVDNDENGSPDLIVEGNDSWTDYQHLSAAELVEKLRVELKEVLDTVEVTKEALEDIITEYNEASLDSDPESANYSAWAKFKKAGLILKVEDLGNVTSEGYEEPFENEARAMYEKMVEEDLTAHISQNNVSTRYGYHLMYSGGYTEKSDAYPEDDTLVYPSREDIVKYNNNDIEQSYSAMLFIERYYKPMKDKYLTSNELVIYDKERARLGDIEFNDSSVQTLYAKILEANQRLVERNQ
ncbi:hypothetical protein RJG79_02825 [Mycoplasmatota bacterium WC44]